MIRTLFGITLGLVPVRVRTRVKLEEANVTGLHLDCLRGDPLGPSHRDQVYSQRHSRHNSLEANKRSKTFLALSTVTKLLKSRAHRMDDILARLATTLPRQNI